MGYIKNANSKHQITKSERESAVRDLPLTKTFNLKVFNVNVRTRNSYSWLRFITFKMALNRIKQFRYHKASKKTEMDI